jgi:hypothetical protein
VPETEEEAPFRFSPFCGPAGRRADPLQAEMTPPLPDQGKRGLFIAQPIPATKANSFN